MMQEPKEYTLALGGMKCGSCEKIIERTIVRNGAEPLEIDAGRGIVAIRCMEERIDSVKAELAGQGFRERAEGENPDRGDFSRVAAYARAVIANEPHVLVENRLLNYAAGTAAVLIVMGALSYGAFLGAFDSASIALTFIALTIASTVMSVYLLSHMETYRNGMTCSNGMMVGMTSGMASGYMIGAIVGATNGMFIGSVAGTAAGIALGLNLGRYSGIMGAMEGIMAGLMAGTMGAMTSIMMINDNLIPFLYILGGICAVTAAGLGYMMHREAGPAPKTAMKGGFARFAGLSIALCIMMGAIMLYGPRALITI